MMFFFYGKHDLGPRLKSYRASTVGEKSTITIILISWGPSLAGSDLNG